MLHPSNTSNTPATRLTPQVAAKQLEIFKAKCGYVPWKQVFVERYNLQQNWLNGTCFVRTFEGHTQVGKLAELVPNYYISYCRVGGVSLYHVFYRVSRVYSLMIIG